MERMLKNLYMVSQRAGVDIEENLPQFRAMLQHVIYLAQARGVPLHYQFRYTSQGPHSYDLTKDYYAFNEQSQKIVEETAGQTLIKQCDEQVDQIRRLKSLTPHGVQTIDWMRYASSVHWIATERELSYAEAVETLSQSMPAITGVSEKLIAAMKECGLPEIDQAYRNDQTPALLSVAGDHKTQNEPQQK